MRIGIYGGTFSPIHKGHILVAKEFIRQLELDTLFVIPVAIPPHKTEKQHIPSHFRLEMCKLAFEDEEKIIVSDLEIARGGKSYTAETLDSLKKTYPNDELFLLCGTDMILTFDSWYRYLDILDMCTVVYVRREKNVDLDAQIENKICFFKEQRGAVIRHIDISPIEISSSDLRKMIFKGLDVSCFVPEVIIAYIKKNGLYMCDCLEGKNEQ